PGQVKSNRRSHIRCTFNSNMSVRLSNKSINHAQAESCPFANLFGRKERLKHAIQHFRRDPASGVCDGESDVWSSQASRNIALSQYEIARLDLEYTAIR